jgi:hypothetical protein
MQIDMLIFYAPSKPLQEDIIDSSSFAVHADLDLMRLQQAGELNL